MIKRKVVIPLFLTLVSFYCISQDMSDLKLFLQETKWYTGAYQFHHGDSLEFISDTDVEYYMGELGWEFGSTYEISGDTLTILTICAAFEVNDTSGLKPDLMQKYKIKEDSLCLFYLGHFRKDKWIETEKVTYKKIYNFKKVK